MRDALRRAEGTAARRDISDPGDLCQYGYGLRFGRAFTAFFRVANGLAACGRTSDETGRPSAARSFAPAGGRAAPLEQVRKQDILDSKRIRGAGRARRRIEGRTTGMQVIVRAGIAAATVAAVAGIATQASAQPAVEQFYRGKSVEMIIGYPPAGSNDTYARALARHIGKHIPGTAQRGAEEHAGGRQLPRAQQRLQRLAQGRHRAGDRRADGRARRAPRHRQRALQDRGVRLGRARRLADQHRVHVAHVEGEDLRRRAEDRSRRCRAPARARRSRSIRPS